MEEIKYIGEWLWASNLGHLFTIVSLVAALCATISYYFSAQQQTSNVESSRAWRNLARGAFCINFLSILGIFTLLFFLIFKHRFEFQYVWQHSSLELPVYYMISCFWEGQEGSFLLWGFWTAVLGLVVMKTANRWEPTVMTWMSIMQVFLAAMLIGIYFFGYKIGSSPFMLLRDVQPGMPLFMRPNYVELIPNGNGLNPLLQNYWMVIHPPTLFLGFAATLLPFSYVQSALWKKDFSPEWVRPTLIWSLFAAAILGIGILMGGAWAYEALSFGGFWAWDPVENASLVPWIILIAGLHTLLAYKSSGHALRITAIFLSLSFLLILYSTFLTRSGILGDTSVHAFTDLGMSGQLLVFMLTFVLLSVVFLAYNWKAMPAPEKEENAYSREFWIFVSALLLLMLGSLITIDTSWPVINKIFGTNTVITDAVSHYNRYAIWFGIVLALLSAVVQYFRYKKTSLQTFLQKLAISTIIALLLTAVIAWQLKMSWWVYNLFLFTGLYVVIANLGYLITVLKGKVKVAGGSVAHIGFGLMLVGILISSAKKEVISLNTLGIDYGEEFEEKDKRENILLYKSKPVQMNDYWVTYVGDTIQGPNTLHIVRYEKKKKETDSPAEVFTLYPNSQVNPKMGLIANPDTRHYWYKDVFTHVSSISDNTKKAEEAVNKKLEIEIGKTKAFDDQLLILVERINPNPLGIGFVPMEGDIAAGAILQVAHKNGEKYTAEPIYYIRNSQENSQEAVVDELGLTLKFEKILPEKNSIVLDVIQRKVGAEFIIMKAIVFPHINLLWLGCIVMSIGFIISMMNRYQEIKRNRGRIKS